MSTKYNDYKGKAALDSANDALKKISSILEDQGIDVSRFQVIGLEVEMYNGRYHYTPLCFDTKKEEIAKLLTPVPITDSNFDYIADAFSAFVSHSKYPIDDIREIRETYACEERISINPGDFEILFDDDITSILSKIETQDALIEKIKDPNCQVLINDEKGQHIYLLTWDKRTDWIKAYPYVETINIRS